LEPFYGFFIIIFTIMVFTIFRFDLIARPPVMKES